MHLIPREVFHVLSNVSSATKLTSKTQLDKLLIAQVGFLAQRRLARGVKLNHAEATVGTSKQVCCHLFVG